MVDYAGKQLGHYRLLRLIGQGGFADVYLGEHIHLNTQVAIKVLQMRLVGNNLEQFRNEARTVASLAHPHIVRVYDFGVDDGIPFLVMDYAANGTLRQRHTQGVPVSLPVIIPYVKQVSAALQYAHDHKCIHRDIKPENMLLAANNEVLLSDFGLALIVQSTGSRSIQEMTGTVSYMSPEQLQGKPGPASDQYALGIVVYEWISGIRPFQGTFYEVASQQMLASPPSLRVRLPDIPAEIEQVVLKAIAKDPQQRFESVQAFAQALEDAAHHVPSFQEISDDAPTFIKPLAALSASPAVTLPVTDQPPLPTYAPTVPFDSISHASASEMESPYGRNAQVKASSHPEQNRETPAEKRTEAKRGISRRNALIGLVGLVVASSATGYLATTGKLETLFAANHHTPPSPTATHRATPTDTTTPTTNPFPSSGTMMGFDAQHTNFNSAEHILSPANVSHLILAWKATTGNSVASQPAIANGVVYFGSSDGKLYAYHATTGQLLWATNVNTGGGSSPAAANGIVYIGALDNNLYACNAITGKVLWTAPLTSQCFSSPTVFNGVVYIGSSKGISTLDDTVYAFRADSGKAIWKASTNSTINGSAPAVANGIVYIGAGNGNLYAFHADTGQQLWTVATGGSIAMSSPAVVNGIVYIGSDRQVLYAINAITGKILWGARTGNWIRTSPAVANGVVYIGSNDRTLYAFHADTGKFLWSTPNIAPSTPMIANGVVYVGSDNNRVYALDAGTGLILWSTPAGSFFLNSPTVANEMLYIGSSDYNVYAFHLP